AARRSAEPHSIPKPTPNSSEKIGKNRCCTSSCSHVYVAGGSSPTQGTLTPMIVPMLAKRMPHSATPRITSRSSSRVVIPEEVRVPPAEGVEEETDVVDTPSRVTNARLDSKSATREGGPQ